MTSRHRAQCKALVEETKPAGNGANYFSAVAGQDVFLAPSGASGQPVAIHHYLRI
jgi:hypothetical protein